MFFKNEEKDIQKEPVPWEDAVIMVCEKCSRKMTGDVEHTQEIKKELKGLFKNKYGKKVRVITSSCLDVCPKDRIAIAVASRASGNNFQVYTVGEKARPELFFEEIEKNLERSY